MYLCKRGERAGAAFCRAIKGRLRIGGQPQPSFCLLRKHSVIRSQRRTLIVRTHCEAFDSTRKLLAQRGIRSQVVYKTDQDDRALALVGAGVGVALMPA